MASKLPKAEGLEDTKIMIRSVVMSCKEGLTFRELSKDFIQFTSKILDPGVFGFNSLQDFLESIRDTVSLRYLGGEMKVFAVNTAETAELAKLINKQKAKPKKKITRMSRLSHVSSSYRPGPSSRYRHSMGSTDYRPHKPAPRLSGYTPQSNYTHKAPQSSVSRQTAFQFDNAYRQGQGDTTNATSRPLTDSNSRLGSRTTVDSQRSTGPSAPPLGNGASAKRPTLDMTIVSRVMTNVSQNNSTRTSNWESGVAGRIDESIDTTPEAARNRPKSGDWASRMVTFTSEPKTAPPPVTSNNSRNVFHFGTQNSLPEGSAPAAPKASVPRINGASTTLATNVSTSSFNGAAMPLASRSSVPSMNGAAMQLAPKAALLATKGSAFQSTAPQLPTAVNVGVLVETKRPEHARSVTPVELFNVVTSILLDNGGNSIPPRQFLTYLNVHMGLYVHPLMCHILMFYISHFWCDVFDVERDARGDWKLVGLRDGHRLKEMPQPLELHPHYQQAQHTIHVQCSKLYAVFKTYLVVLAHVLAEEAAQKQQAFNQEIAKTNPEGNFVLWRVGEMCAVLLDDRVDLEDGYVELTMDSWYRGLILSTHLSNMRRYADVLLIDVGRCAHLVDAQCRSIPLEYYYPTPVAYLALDDYDVKDDKVFADYITKIYKGQEVRFQAKSIQLDNMLNVVSSAFSVEAGYLSEGLYISQIGCFGQRSPAAVVFDYFKDSIVRLKTLDELPQVRVQLSGPARTKELADYENLLLENALSGFNEDAYRRMVGELVVGTRMPGENRTRLNQAMRVRIESVKKSTGMASVYLVDRGEKLQLPLKQLFRMPVARNVGGHLPYHMTSLRLALISAVPYLDEDFAKSRLGQDYEVSTIDERYVLRNVETGSYLNIELIVQTIQKMHSGHFSVPVIPYNVSSSCVMSYRLDMWTKDLLVRIQMVRSLLGQLLDTQHTDKILIPVTAETRPQVGELLVCGLYDPKAPNIVGPAFGDRVKVERGEKSLVLRPMDTYAAPIPLSDDLRGLYRLPQHLPNCDCKEVNFTLACARDLPGQVLTAQLSRMVTLPPPGERIQLNFHTSGPREDGIPRAEVESYGDFLASSMAGVDLNGSDSFAEVVVE